LFENTKEAEHNLTNAVVLYTGTLSTILSWKPYSMMLTKYMKLVKAKPQMLKLLLRVVVGIINGFHFNAVQPPPPGRSKPKPKPKALAGAANPSSKPPPPSYLCKFCKVPGHWVTECPSIGAVAEADADGDGLPKGTPQEHSIHLACTKRIIPALYSHLTIKDEEGAGLTMRPQIALAIVNLLVKLPKVTLEAKLPQLVVKLTAVLRDRLQSTRDQARTTLGDIMQILGPFYAPFVIKELKSGLTRGYQLHVLGYTVHYVLQGLGDNLPAGCLDDAVEECVAIFIDDVFGIQAEEKEEYQIAAKLKEARNTQSFDSFRILGRAVNPKSLAAMFESLKDVMCTSESLKKSEKLDEIFRNLCTGINANVGMTPVAKMQVALDLIHTNYKLSKEGKKSKIDKSHREESIKIFKAEPGRVRPIDANFNTNAHLLVELGILLLLTLLKQGKVSRGEEEHLEHLNSLVPTLTECLQSKYNKLAGLAIRALALTLKFGEELLPSLNAHVGRINQRVFKLMRIGGQSQAAVDLNQACFRLIAVLVRDCPWHAVTENEVKVLLSFAEQDLETSGKQNTVFVVLKAIIARKLIATELYDVMDRVSELMIRTHAPGIRELCRQVLLPFLLEYPLGKKRLEKQINFLVSNLDFEHETGRESALTMLESVTIKFPAEIVEEYADLFFVSLIKQLVNGTSPLLRETASNCLQLLIDSVGPAKQDVLHSMAVCWMEQGSPELCRAAVQVVSLFVETMHKGYSRYVAETVPALKKVLLDNAPDLDEDGHLVDRNASFTVDGVEDDAWEVVYLALGAVSKIFGVFPKELEMSVIIAPAASEAAAAPADEDEAGRSKKKRRKDRGKVLVETGKGDENSRMWSAVEAWLLYDHAWVRLAAARLFRVYITARDPAVFVKPAGNEYLALPGVVFRVGKAFTTQLESTRMSKDLGDVLVKNLVFVVRVLAAIHAEYEASPAGMAAAAANAAAAAAIAGNSKAGDDAAGAAAAAAAAAGAAAGEGGDLDAFWNSAEAIGTAVPSAKVAAVGAQTRRGRSKNPSGLMWTIKQLGYMARQETNTTPEVAVRRDCVFKVVAAMVQFMGTVDRIKPFLDTIVESLYRTEENEASPDDIKDLSSQVQKLVQKTVGNAAFFTSFNAARDKVAKARAARKLERLQEAVIDPTKAAQRKIKDNLKKKFSRKRKIQRLREEAGKSSKRIYRPGQEPGSNA